MIRRVNSGKNHHYVDDATGRRVPSVTTILDKGIPKPALVKWSGDATAEAAVDRWEELSELPPATRLKELRAARYATRDAAANRGSQVHALAERLAMGETVTVPDELTGHVGSYVQFLDEWDVQPVMLERVVHSKRHDYCGTFDMIADLLDPWDPEPDPALRRRVRWLLDIKTNRSGVFGETALQLAAYRYADVVIDEEAGEEIPMPEVEATGVVHVRADGYDLVPVVAGPAQHRTFLYVQQVAAFTEGGRDLIGEPLVSPQTSAYTLIRSES